MRKITLLLSFVLCAILANTQNLLVNPGFETWSANSPTGWTLTTANGTTTQSAVAATGASALQIAATSRFDVTQIVPATGETFDTSKKYKMSIKYKITAGDGTDLRIWCGLITSATGVSPITYYNGTPPSAADSAMYYWPLHGPNGKSSTTGYFGYNAANQDWQTHTYEFFPPVGITQFSFQIRNYTGATVILDDFYFGISETTDIATPSADNLNVSMAGKTLTVTNSPVSTVEIYNTLGVKVKTAQLVNGSADLDIQKGIYIVRAGNKSVKIRI
ncbi:MAG: T9SS type A sorting domain-containing protein [Paludibacter sp.]